MRYIAGGEQYEIDLAAATRDELLEAQDRIGDFRGVIQGKIDQANADRAAGLGYADMRDYARWKGIARRLGGQMRKLNRALARKGDERKAARLVSRRVEQTDFGRCFVECARALLHPDTFDEIVLATQAMKEQRDAGTQDA